MSDPRAGGSMKGAVQGIVAAGGVIIACITLTYTLTAQSMRPRVEKLESQSLELEKAFIRIDTKLENIIDVVGDLKDSIRGTPQ